MDSRRTRREVLQAAGASVGALAGLDELALGQRRRDRPNVVLIVIDTLRSDHVYGKRARTPNMDALIRRGLSFSRCYPEAMPTVPARRSIMTGRRVFPFKGWHPWPQLPQEPGWAPIAEPAITFTSVLRRAGWWTACVTDNTFLGFAPCYAPYRGSFNRFVRRGGQAGGPLGRGAAGRRARAPALRARRGRVRAARAVDPAAALHRHVRGSRLPRSGALPALVPAGGGLPAREPRGGAARADEGPLRSRGHAHGPLARSLP